MSSSKASPLKSLVQKYKVEEEKALTAVKHKTEVEEDENKNSLAESIDLDKDDKEKDSIIDDSPPPP